ncbi:hypothetical protein ABTX81_19960 [Kitasatospora sp. NPDC097605]|uniref:hypothetical protein n=1 Tax=Kitasatospora sp. NPDC097605 TaxID=3157226 RepID=UPI0033321B67
MVSLRTTLRTAAAAAVLVGLGAGAAHAAGWPPLHEGGYLYAGAGGTGAVTVVDLGDLGTCHTLAGPVRSAQVVDGAASVVLYTGAGCTGAHPWATGSLAQSDLPAAALSYRVVPA